MSIKKNIVKGWITSIIGTLMMLGALFLWFGGLLKTWPDTTVAMALGCLLLIAPRSIEKIILKWVGNKEIPSNTDNNEPSDAK